MPIETSKHKKVQELCKYAAADNLTLFKQLLESDPSLLNVEFEQGYRCIHYAVSAKGKILRQKS